jgi:hypothetical protein
MSAKITKIDRVFLTKIPELFDGRGWHKQGTPTDTITAETVAPILFSHRFEPAGVFVNGEFVTTGEQYATANDNNLPIGKAVSTRYATPSNAELFELIREALAGSDYGIVSAGTLDGRNEFFVDAKGTNMRAAGRDIAPFVGLHRCFGGDSSVAIGGHTMVVQCANTTALMRREFSKREDNVSIKNTLGIYARLPEVKAEIERVHGVNAMFARAMEDSASEKIVRDDARAAFVGLIAGDKPKLEGKRVARTVNRANRLLELWGTGAGNGGENVADWFNAVTDFYSHENAGSEDGADSKGEFLEKQWYSSERGSGAAVKSRVSGLLFDKGTLVRPAFYSLRDTGAAILAASAAEIVVDLN